MPGSPSGNGTYRWLLGGHGPSASQCQHRPSDAECLYQSCAPQSACGLASKPRSSNHQGAYILVRVLHL